MNKKHFEIVATVGSNSKLISIGFCDHELTTILSKSNVFEEIQDKLSQAASFEDLSHDEHHINYCSISLEHNEPENDYKLISMDVKRTAVTNEPYQFTNDNVTIVFERTSKPLLNDVEIVLCKGIKGFSFLHYGNDPEFANKIKNDDRLKLNIINLMQDRNMTAFGIYFVKVSVSNADSKIPNSILGIKHSVVASEFFRIWCDSVHGLSNRLYKCVDERTSPKAVIVLCKDSYQGLSILHYGNDPEIARKLQNDATLSLSIFGRMQACDMTESGIYLVKVYSVDSETYTSLLDIKHSSFNSESLKAWCNSVHALSESLA